MGKMSPRNQNYNHVRDDLQMNVLFFLTTYSKNSFKHVSVQTLKKRFAIFQLLCNKSKKFYEIVNFGSRSRASLRSQQREAEAICLIIVVN